MVVEEEGTQEAVERRGKVAAAEVVLGAFLFGEAVTQVQQTDHETTNGARRVPRGIHSSRGPATILQLPPVQQ